MSPKCQAWRKRSSQSPSISAPRVSRMKMRPASRRANIASISSRQSSKGGGSSTEGEGAPTELSPDEILSGARTGGGTSGLALTNSLVTSMWASKQKSFQIDFWLSGASAGKIASASCLSAPKDMMRFKPRKTRVSCSALRAARRSRSRSPCASALSDAVSQYIWKKSSTRYGIRSCHRSLTGGEMLSGNSGMGVCDDSDASGV